MAIGSVCGSRISRSSPRTAGSENSVSSSPSSIHLQGGLGWGGLTVGLWGGEDQIQHSLRETWDAHEGGDGIGGAG